MPASGKCFYCKQGFSSRCEKNTLFGCERLDGGQAQYVCLTLSAVYLKDCPLSKLYARSASPTPRAQS